MSEYTSYYQMGLPALEYQFMVIGVWFKGVFVAGEYGGKTWVRGMKEERQ